MSVAAAKVDVGIFVLKFALSVGSFSAALHHTSLMPDSQLTMLVLQYIDTLPILEKT